MNGECCVQHVECSLLLEIQHRCGLIVPVGAGFPHGGASFGETSQITSRCARNAQYDRQKDAQRRARKGTAYHGT